MAYLQSDEYGTYGLDATTGADVVGQASTIIDTWLRRPEGLVWTADAAGQPCYMAAKTPSFTFNLTAPISPGANVVATVSGPAAMLQPGDVLIADRATPTATEAVTVQAVSGQAVTLRGVTYSHASAAALDAGMVIQEQRFTPKLRPIINLQHAPVARILSGSGRYGYSRRGDAAYSNTDDFNLLAALSKFGGPPAWEIFDPSLTDVDPITGQCWIPAGIMLAYYTEVKVRYVAGFSLANIPPAIKQACATIANTLLEAPNLGAVKRYQAGGTTIERFADTMIGADVVRMLQPYRVRAIA